MFKNFLMKKMLKSQMKGIPEDQQDKIINAIEKNPEFFTKIATDIKQKMKEGKTQTVAAMEVMRKNQDEIRKIMQG